MITTPQGRFSFTYFDEATIYPDHMKWSFNLPLLWRGRSDFEQVYRDLTAIRRFREFLRPVAAPVYDLWTSAAYPMGVPIERRYHPIAIIDGKNLDIESDGQHVFDYFNGVYTRLSFREFLLRRTLNETYGKYGR